jgi:predicted ATP-binding protein involved in virulence
MFIENIKINQVRHLKNLEIHLGEHQQHLILTGKNGSGKTTLLNALAGYLDRVKNGDYLPKELMEKDLIHFQDQIVTLKKENRDPAQEAAYQTALSQVSAIDKWLAPFKALELHFADVSAMAEQLNNNRFIIKNFGATSRNSKMAIPQGVEKIDLAKVKNDNGQLWFLKYMVHLQTQLAYAALSKNQVKIDKIQDWFYRFESLLKTIFESDSMALKYDENQYNFILCDGDKSFDFNTLSDGFSAVLDIITSMMMSMEVEANDETQTLALYDVHGIVLIDEIDTHLHISLQKSIFRILTDFFPNIQFIVTTHSPFIINSVENAVVYDLEQSEVLEHMEIYSYETIAEVHFGATEYNKIITDKINLYSQLLDKHNKNAEEEVAVAELKAYFDKVKEELPKDIALKIWELERGAV